MANQGFDYNVDLVMCIDGTGSMSDIINEVKENALTFYKKFKTAMDTAGKMVEQLRVKVIVFRDYGYDTNAMEESDFFVLSDDDTDQSAAFQAFVNGIEAAGGGDGPENALEALYLAFNSDWVRTGNVRRHVVHLYTDAPALPLGARKSAPGYPADMAADIGELQEVWTGQLMEKRAKRLQIFAPDCDSWNQFIPWDNTILTASKAGAGCGDVDMETCIHLLVKSI